jgi:two-component system chemotaxis response regulator CheY
MQTNIDEKKFKILVATENSNYRNTLGQKLRLDGYSVEFVSGGFHLLHLIERFEYHLVIVHENMNDMPAQEIVSLIRTTKSKTDLPIIYVSQDKREENICELIFVGANDYLVYTANLAPIVDRTKKYFQLVKVS